MHVDSVGIAIFNHSTRILFWRCSAACTVIAVVSAALLFKDVTLDVHWQLKVNATLSGNLLSRIDCTALQRLRCANAR